MNRPRTSALGAIAILALLLVGCLYLAGGVGFLRDRLGSSPRMTRDEAIQKAIEDSKRNQPEIWMLEARVDQVAAEQISASEAWDRLGNSTSLPAGWASFPSNPVWWVTVKGYFRYESGPPSVDGTYFPGEAREQVFVYDARSGDQMSGAISGAPAAPSTPGPTPTPAPTPTAAAAVTVTPTPDQVSEAKQAIVLTEQAMQATADAGYHAPKTTLPIVTSCPEAADLPPVGIHPFSMEHQPPKGLSPTNVAIMRSRSGRVYAIYAGGKSDDPKQGVLVLWEQSTDPCASAAGLGPGTQPTYYSYPNWPGPLRIISIGSDEIMIETGAGWSTSVPIFEARSGRISQGQAYPYVLTTHCGLDRAVDFDGSVWALDDPAWAGDSGIGSRIGFNIQAGTMTLVDANYALFKFDSGAIRGEIRFQRQQGAKLLSGGCA